MRLEDMKLACELDTTFLQYGRLLYMYLSNIVSIMQEKYIPAR
jgi:hypothetical protein